MQLLGALINGSGQRKWNLADPHPESHERHLWLALLRLPDSIDDLQAVTLSIGDITNRKRIETSLIERERFWSDVVKAVPTPSMYTTCAASG